VQKNIVEVDKGMLKLKAINVNLYAEVVQFYPKVQNDVYSESKEYLVFVSKSEDYIESDSLLFQDYSKLLMYPQNLSLLPSNRYFKKYDNVLHPNELVAPLFKFPEAFMYEYPEIIEGNEKVMVIKNMDPNNWELKLHKESTDIGICQVTHPKVATKKATYKYMITNELRLSQKQREELDIQGNFWMRKAWNEALFNL